MPCSPSARTDAADHAGHVGVAEEGEVGVVELDVEALAPGLQQVRAVMMAERGADDLHPLAGGDDRDPHQVGVVARAHLAALGDRDPALLGERRGVDEVDAPPRCGRRTGR